MTRPNKLEGLSLETLCSQVLEFEGKAKANPIGAPFGCFRLGKLLVLPANVRLDWKVIARYKHSSFFGLIVTNDEKKFYNMDTCADLDEKNSSAEIPSNSSAWDPEQRRRADLAGAATFSETSVSRLKMRGAGSLQSLQRDWASPTPALDSDLLPRLELLFSSSMTNKPIEQHVLDTNAGKPLSYAATDV